MILPAVQVEQIGKEYVLGLRQRAHQTFREAIIELATSPLRRFRHLAGDSQNGRFWALRDITFEVPEGEVLGIIGHNGSGKSTLLKILSRITEPTEGRAVVRGRVGSLLEVGTGFHPELTGRENVFLNGAILGMSRAEIDRKFDEIVDFAGIEQFLDTPIKRYSSGMKVRLAFAVAAHLEPEILVIDEVLAVGDAEFQRKCLGKMKDVSSSGRTVLFVSHNMAAVESLCTRVLLLRDGRVQAMTTPEEGIRTYLRSSAGQHHGGFVDLAQHPQRAIKRESCVLHGLRLSDGEGHPTQAISVGQTMGFHLELACETPIHHPAVCITLYDYLGVRVTTMHTEYQFPELRQLEGNVSLCCTLRNCRLAPGVYSLTIWVTGNGVPVDRVDNAVNIEIHPGDVYGTGKHLRRNAGLYISESTWHLESASASGHGKLPAPDQRDATPLERH